MTALDAVGIHQNVQIAAQLLHALVEHAVALLALTQIALDALTVIALCLQAASHFIHLVGRTDDDHLGAGLQKALCHTEAETAGTAGHDDFLAADIKQIIFHTIHLSFLPPADGTSYSVPLIISFLYRNCHTSAGEFSPGILYRLPKGLYSFRATTIG